MRWLPLLLALAILAAGALAQTPNDDLMKKQMAMLAAEAQFFSALAQNQRDELEKLKATPCAGEPK